MTKLRMAFMTGASMLVVSAGAGAQLRGTASIPRGFMPPAGMCRVWYDGVAPGRQPAPTDCATARANVRSNSRLVYGESLRPNDPRGGYDGTNNQGRWYDPSTIVNGNGGTYGRGANDGRYDGRDGRLSERERQRLERERLERERIERDRERLREQERREREASVDRRARDNRGVYTNGRTGTTTQGPWNRGVGTSTNGTTNGRGQCVDANHDGRCDTNVHPWP